MRPRSIGLPTSPRFTAAVALLSILALSGGQRAMRGSSFPFLGSAIDARLQVGRETTFGAFLTDPAGSTTFGSTAAIIGADGSIKARATFTPPPVPYVSATASAVLPPQGVSKRSGLYFYDYEGVIRLLASSGAVRTIARIPLDKPGRQELSFAVSPDEKEIVASVITFPAKPAHPSVEHPFAPGAATVDVYQATVGRAARLLRHNEYRQQEIEGFSNGLLVVLGWDALGPFGVVNTWYATQVPNVARVYGQAVRIAPTGNVGSPLCARGSAIAGIADGTVACQLDNRVDVVSVSGKILWSVPWDTHSRLGDSAWDFATLAPDARHICLESPREPETDSVFGRDGSRVVLPPSYACRGWVDATTIVGTFRSRNSMQSVTVGLIDLARPARVIDLKSSATFVGDI